MTEIATFLSERLLPGADLTRPELNELACTIGKDESLWKQFERHDADERQYQQLYRDPNIDVWLIC